MNRINCVGTPFTENISALAARWKKQFLLGNEALATHISVRLSILTMTPPKCLPDYWREFPGSRVFQPELQVELHSSSFQKLFLVECWADLQSLMVLVQIWSEFSSTWPLFPGQWCASGFLVNLWEAPTRWEPAGSWHQGLHSSAQWNCEPHT